MKISNLGVSFQSTASSHATIAAKNVSADSKRTDAETARSYVIPAAFSFGSGAIGSMQIDDPKAAFDAMAQKFQTPTLRDIVLNRTGRANDGDFHGKQYYATVSSMFEQMMPMFEAAARDLVGDIRAQHTNENGELTDEGKKALAEVMDTLEQARTNAQNIRDRAANGPAVNSDDAKLNAHQKALEEQEKLREAYWEAFAGQTEGDNIDETTARFDRVISALGALRDGLTSFRSPSPGSRIDVVA